MFWNELVLTIRFLHCADLCCFGDVDLCWGFGLLDLMHRHIWSDSRSLFVLPSTVLKTEQISITPRGRYLIHTFSYCLQFTRLRRIFSNTFCSSGCCPGCLKPKEVRSKYSGNTLIDVGSKPEINLYNPESLDLRFICRAKRRQNQRRIHQYGMKTFCPWRIGILWSEQKLLHAAWIPEFF